MSYVNFNGYYDCPTSDVGSRRRVSGPLTRPNLPEPTITVERVTSEESGKKIVTLVTETTFFNPKQPTSHYVFKKVEMLNQFTVTIEKMVGKSLSDDIVRITCPEIGEFSATFRYRSLGESGNWSENIGGLKHVRNWKNEEGVALERWLNRAISSPNLIPTDKDRDTTDFDKAWKDELETLKATNFKYDLQQAPEEI
jgi:hypothetical protein